MRKSKDLIGMPVVSLEEGIKVGRVTGLVIDPEEKAVTALVVEKGGLLREQKFVPFPQVHSVGANAVTLNKSQSATKGTSLPEILRLFKEKISIIGSKVVAENGTVFGNVVEYRLDTSTGMITTIEIAPTKHSALLQGVKMLDSTLIRTIGKEIVVVGDATEKCLTTVEEGLKDRASHSWEEVKDMGQRLGQTIGTKVKSLRRPGESDKQPVETIEAANSIPEISCQSNNLDTDKSS
ncbi:MAG: PRC-barrel domain-containing protein [Bacillota bacterium]